jgi:hypothetical protein
MQFQRDSMRTGRRADLGIIDQGGTVNYPFEFSFEEVRQDIDEYITSTISSLESDFLIMPRGPGFVDYPDFEYGYEALKKATSSFSELDESAIASTINDTPIALIVLRTILGFTPPEWAHVATQRTGVEISQSAARTIDRDIRFNPHQQLKMTKLKKERIDALIEAACNLLREGAPEVHPVEIHRLDKADTASGLDGIRTAARIGVPYAMLLYERFLGRPFASHRDSVSELVGESMEAPIEEILTRSEIGYRKVIRAERIKGFDQNPDFIIPDEFNPKVIIEAKITQDDGTARDKVTRIQHLGELSLQGTSQDKPRFEVVACISGRGFGIRREDIKKILLATRGKTFTLSTLDRLVECTCLQAFVGKHQD